MALSSCLLTYQFLFTSFSSMPPLALSPSHPLCPPCPVSFSACWMYLIVVLSVAYICPRSSACIYIILCIVLLLFQRACQRAVVCPEPRACRHAWLSASARGTHAYRVIASTRVIVWMLAYRVHAWLRASMWHEHIPRVCQHACACVDERVRTACMRASMCVLVYM